MRCATDRSRPRRAATYLAAIVRRDSRGAPARDPAPRYQAAEYRRGASDRRAAGDGLRAGQAARRPRPADVCRPGDRDPVVHVARTGRGRGGRGARIRRVRAGRDAVRPAHRATAVPGRHSVGNDAPGGVHRAGQPGPLESGDRPRPGNDLPQVPAQGPNAALSVGRAVGGRPDAVPPPRADPSPPGGTLRTSGPLVPPQPGHGGAGPAGRRPVSPRPWSPARSAICGSPRPCVRPTRVSARPARR